jgi:hypothetical protein
MSNFFSDIYLDSIFTLILKKKCTHFSLNIKSGIKRTLPCVVYDNVFDAIMTKVNL